MGNDHWLRISIITFIWIIDTYVAKTTGADLEILKRGKLYVSHHG